MQQRPGWDDWYLALAETIAQRSRDPSTKVGAVIVRPDRTQVSFGYNDFPRGVEHVLARYDDRDWKYPAIVHAEANAILNARGDVTGCTLYSTFHPCARCAALIVQSGISCVVIPDDPIPDRWRSDMEIAETILREGGVAVQAIARPATGFDLARHLERQREFSLKTFGPAGDIDRLAGVLAHINKELSEIAEDPFDLYEWIDVMILAFDGAMRAGYRPSEIIEALVAKQTTNEARNWPDWRNVPAGEPIEHVRD